MGAAEKLAELGVVPASSLADTMANSGAERRLPILSSLSAALPNGLVRGSTVSLTSSGAGGTSLLLALLAGVSAAGAWCAVVGLPALSWPAVFGAGVDLARMAMVPHPGPDAAAVAATLLDGFDLVVVAMAQPAASVCAHLSAKARAGKGVLVTAGAEVWPGAAVTISAESSEWVGRRRLRAQRVGVVVSGRSQPGRPRRAEVWLPTEPPASLQPAQPVHGERAAGRAGRLRVVS